MSLCDLTVQPYDTYGASEVNEVRFLMPVWGIILRGGLKAR